MAVPNPAPFDYTALSAELFTYYTNDPDTELPPVPIGMVAPVTSLQASFLDALACRDHRWLWQYVTDTVAPRSPQEHTAFLHENLFAPHNPQYFETFLRVAGIIFPFEAWCNIATLILVAMSEELPISGHEEEEEEEEVCGCAA